VKNFQVTLNIVVQLDDHADLGAVINALSYVPSIAEGTAKLTGINIYEDKFADQVPLAPGGPISAGSAASLGASIPADEPLEERSGE